MNRTAQPEKSENTEPDGVITSERRKKQGFSQLLTYFRPRGIAARLAITMVAVSIGSVALVGIAAIISTELRVRNPPPDVIQARELLDQLRSNCKEEVSSSGLRVLSCPPEVMKQLPLPPMTTGESLLMLGPTRRDQDGQGKRPDPFDPRRWLVPTFGVGVLFASLFALGLAYLLARRFALPVQAVSQAANRMASGDLASRAELPHLMASDVDETASLARSFNAMAESLERQERTRKAMIADIAHELRTPLAVMQARLEALEDGVFELSQDEVKRLRHQTGLLSRLIEDLRLLSLADAGQLSLERRKVNLSALIQTVTTAFQARACAKSVSIDVQTPATLEAHVDPDRFSQVLTNLLENALQHTPTDGTITVRLSTDIHQVRIEVTDSGPGFPSEALPHVFDRFFRADASRARSSGGSGLGLAIVRALVELHAGNISAANLPNGGGAVVTVLLPRA
jgi:signal transduction histidine kinase